MKDIILVIILLAIAAAIVIYLIKEKRSGAVCVGCPHAKQCAKNHKSGCSCGEKHE